MEDLLSSALSQAPALTIFAITIGWVVRAFLAHLIYITEEHTRTMRKIGEASTEGLRESTQVIRENRHVLKAVVSKLDLEAL